MNKVVLIGRLVKNPEVRQSANGEHSIARFTVAVDRRVAKADQEADFISCLAFDKKAEFIERYFSKGSKVVISGRIQTGSYENKDGNKVYTTDVVCEDLEFGESKKTEQTNAEPKNDFMSIDGDIDGLPFN